LAQGIASIASEARQAKPRSDGFFPTIKMTLEVTYRPVASLVPYARNARTHSDPQVAQIAGSIREFGWTNPGLVDEAGGLIAGHGSLRQSLPPASASNYGFHSRTGTAGC
jgi:hypothetical protein